MGNLSSSIDKENLDEGYGDLVIESSGADDDVVFNLSLLPEDLLHRIVEKMEYKDFAVLDQTSRLGNNICSIGSYSLPFSVKNVYVNAKTTKLVEWYNDWLPDVEKKRIPWHIASSAPVKVVTDFVRIECRATSGRIQAVSKLFDQNRTKADMVSITEHIVFKPEDLERLLKACNPRTLHCRVYLSREFFQWPCMQNLSTLDLDNTGCTDEELLKLKVDDYFRMKNDQITAKGLNKFLKQWKNKEREIFVVKIEFETTAGTRRFEEILEGLGANPIWTPDMHEDSLIGRIPIGELNRMTMGDPEHVYSIWRPDDPENTVFIFLRSGGIEIRQLAGEADYLYYDLDFSQYYFLLEECAICAARFCEHRRRFSTARLRKHFPRIYNCILHGVKALTIASVSIRLSNFSSGERPFTHFSQMEYSTLEYNTGLSRIISLLQIYLLDHV